MTFSGGKMTKGYRYGNGMLTINYDYVCSSNCAACSSATVCTRCFDKFYLYKNACVSKCPSNTLQSGTRCIDCSSPCETCSGSISHCNSCISGYFYFNGKCYKDCTVLNDMKNGVYYGKYTNKRQCLQCKDDNCINCAENYAKCSKCADGFYFDTKSQKCVLNPTNIFTSSAKFSASDYFSHSTVFSQSEVFEKTNDFSQSSLFTQSLGFSRSSDFSYSSIHCILYRL